MKERLRGVEILEPGFSKEAVRRNAELAHDWQWQGMTRSLCTWTDRFRNRLLDPIARLGRDSMPDAVISFESMDHRILACYTLHRNAQGLLEMEAECEHPSARERAFAYMFTHAVPALKAAGFTEDDIRAFLVSNPRRYFAQ